MKDQDLFSEDHEATYCPEDNKIRLYVGHLPRPEYDALRAEGWTSTPKQSKAGQGEFAAVWSTRREDTAQSYAGFIGDEDTGPTDRAADRAERFGGYRDNRRADANERADKYDEGPSVHGYQNKAKAVRAADRHDRHADRALDNWSKAEYWQTRTAGVISHALYVSEPGVRMGRIKKLEKEERSEKKGLETYRINFGLWKKVQAMTDPEKAFKHAYYLANTGGSGYGYHHPRPETATEYMKEHGTSLYSLLTYEPDPITGHEAAALWLDGCQKPTGTSRYLRHVELRLAYENQMLEAQGGRAAAVDMIPGGWIGNKQIQKVNKSNATGRVVSVDVWGESNLYTAESGYKEREKRPVLVKIETERLAPDAYRAPTEEEQTGFEAAKKARKASKPKVSFINPTLEAAQKLQEKWNTEAAETDKGNNYPRKPGEVYECTQARYSGIYKDSKTTITQDGIKLRVYAPGWSRIAGIVVLTDKKQKPLPAELLTPIPAPVEEEQAPEPEAIPETATVKQAEMVLS